MRAGCLWSAGKDSCLACYKAKAEGHQIIRLFNFINAQGSLGHGLAPELIRDQAGLTGIALVQKNMPAPGEDYEGAFKGLILDYKIKENLEAIVFGDIYLIEHRDWIVKVCKQIGILPIFPLWGIDTQKIIDDFVGLGFQAMITCVKPQLLTDKWLARHIDKNFIRDLSDYNPQIDVCGEKGEFHTLVTGGPLFSGRIAPVETAIKNEGNYRILEIKKYKVV